MAGNSIPSETTKDDNSILQKQLRPATLYLIGLYLQRQQRPTNLDLQRQLRPTDNSILQKQLMPTTLYLIPSEATKADKSRPSEATTADRQLYPSEATKAGNSIPSEAAKADRQLYTFVMHKSNWCWSHALITIIIIIFI